MSGIIEFSFHKCNEYFVKRWDLAQRNIAEQGHFGKARAEHLKEAEKLAKQHTTKPYGPRWHVFSVRGRVAQVWAANVMLDETTEWI